MKFSGKSKHIELKIWIMDKISLIVDGKTSNKRRKNETFCCQNYEERDNKCVECRPGFRGKNCNSTCPDNHYGQLCKKNCICDGEKEYCHPVCGRVAKLKSFENETTDDTSTDRVNTQTSLPEKCFILRDNKQGVWLTTAEIKHDLLHSTEATTNLIIHKDVKSILLVVLPSAVFVFFLLSAGLAYSYYFSKKREESKDIHHNALYGNEDGYAAENGQNRAVTSEDTVYDSCEEGCYSTLALRVNCGSIYTNIHEGSPQTAPTNNSPYDFVFDGVRHKNKLQDCSSCVNNSYHTHESSGSCDIKSDERLYEDAWSNDTNNSLLRHFTQRQFDLMPVGAKSSALQDRELGPYELAYSNQEGEIDFNLNK